MTGYHYDIWTPDDFYLENISFLELRKKTGNGSSNERTDELTDTSFRIIRISGYLWVCQTMPVRHSTVDRFMSFGNFTRVHDNNEPPSQLIISNGQSRTDAVPRRCAISFVNRKPICRLGYISRLLELEKKKLEKRQRKAFKWSKHLTKQKPGSNKSRPSRPTRGPWTYWAHGAH